MCCCIFDRIRKHLTPLDECVLEACDETFTMTDGAYKSVEGWTHILYQSGRRMTGQQSTGHRSWHISAMMQEQ